MGSSLREAPAIRALRSRQTDRLAAARYLTVAPNLFSAGDARQYLVSTVRAMGSGQDRAYAESLPSGDGASS